MSCWILQNGCVKSQNYKRSGRKYYNFYRKYKRTSPNEIDQSTSVCYVNADWTNRLTKKNEEEHPADHILTVDHSNHSKLNPANWISQMDKGTDNLISPRNHSGSPTLHDTISNTKFNPNGIPTRIHATIKTTETNPSGSLIVIVIGFNNISTTSSTTNHLDPNQDSNIQQIVSPAIMVHQLSVSVHAAVSIIVSLKNVEELGIGVAFVFNLISF